MQSGGEKSPEDELNALLRQAGARPIRTSGINLPPTAPKVRRPITMPKANWLAIAISGLALLLVFGTGYFLLMGIKFNTGQLTFELNESPVALKIDERSAGEVNNGSIITLRAGEHTLTFSKEGFLESERVVKILRSSKDLLSVQILPIPTIEKLVDGDVRYARLNQNGEEASYYDVASATFRTVKTAEKNPDSLFRGSFSNIAGVAWSSVTQAAIVKLTGQSSLPNMLDNRGVKGRYVVLGERPSQGKAKSDGTSTWLFDDNLKSSVGWQPVLLNESVRQVAFSYDGSEILYIYDTADGEYSLVRSLPGGEEWERVIVDFPKLGDPKLNWGADDRYAVLESNGDLYAIDLVGKTIDQILKDRINGSGYSLSPDGSTVAYLADEGGVVRLKTYSLVNNETVVLDKAAVEKGTIMVWLNVNDLLLLEPNQMFVRLNVESQDKLNIPFKGDEIDFQIRRMEYSVLGQLLMLDTSQGLYVIRM